MYNGLGTHLLACPAFEGHPLAYGCQECYLEVANPDQTQRLLPTINASGGS